MDPFLSDHGKGPLVPRVVGSLEQRRFPVLLPDAGAARLPGKINFRKTAADVGRIDSTDARAYGCDRRAGSFPKSCDLPGAARAGFRSPLSSRNLEQKSLQIVGLRDEGVYRMVGGLLHELQ